MSYPAPDIWLPMRSDDLQMDNTGSEQVNDWAMSDVGTTAWTAVNGAVLTKVSNGGAGQALRIERGASPNPQATQVVTTTGQWYKLKIRVRSDGGITGKFFLGATTLCEFTTSTSWQTYEFDHLSAGTTLIVQADGILSGDYIEVDILSALDFDSRTLDISGNGDHAILGDGMTDLTYPTQLHDHGVDFGRLGTNYMEIPAGALQSSPSALTVSILIDNADEGGVTRDFVSAYDGTNTYFILTSIRSLSVFRFYVGSLVFSNSANFPFAAGDNELTHLIGEWTGSATNIYKNLEKGTAASSSIAPTYNNQTINFCRRETSILWRGRGFDFQLWWDVLTADEKRELNYDLLRKHGRYHV